MRYARWPRMAGVLALLVGTNLAIGLAQETVLWAPKPTQLPQYNILPKGPHVKLADVKARHSGQTE